MRPGISVVLFVFVQALSACRQVPAPERPPAPEATRREKDTGTPPRGSDPVRAATEEPDLALIRARIEHEDREAARAILSRAVSRWTDPARGPSAEPVLLELADLAEALGAFRDALPLQERILALREALPPDDPARLETMGKLGVACWMVGDHQRGGALFEAVHAVWEQLAPPEDPRRLRAKMRCAFPLEARGELAASRSLLEEVLEAQRRFLSPGENDLLLTQVNLAGNLIKSQQRSPTPGLLDRARELLETAYRDWEEHGKQDTPCVGALRNDLALLRFDAGDLVGARELQELVLAEQRRLLPADHADLLLTMNNLAETRRRQGDPQGALELQREVLVANTRNFPRDHPDRLRAMVNLGMIRYSLGDYAGAAEIQESVIQAESRGLAPEAPELLEAKLHLALTRKTCGDLIGAQALEESVLETRTHELGPEHPGVLDAKQCLAQTRRALGDLPGALELEQAVLEARLRTLPPENERVLVAKNNLGVTYDALGDLTESRRLFEDVLAALERDPASDDRKLFVPRLNVAVIRKEMGDLQGAEQLLSSLLATGTSRTALGSPYSVIMAEQALGETKRLLENPAGARPLEEAALAALGKRVPRDDPAYLAAQRNLAATLAELGERDAARELLSELLAGMRQCARSLLAQAPRAAREGTWREMARLQDVLDQTRDEPGLQAEILATLEALRFTAQEGPGVHLAAATNAALAECLRASRDARRRMSDLAAATPAAAGEGWNGRLLAIAEERDRAERRLRQALLETGALGTELDVAALASTLAPGSAAVSFLRRSRLHDGWRSKKLRPDEETLLAFLLLPDGTVRRLDLGPAGAIEDLVGEWRQALGRPLERGIASADPAARSEVELGRLLRARLLDPLLETAGKGVVELRLVLDDFLHLVPLDALPLEGEGRVGERLRICIEPTLAAPSVRLAAEPGKGTLVALGGIDFDADPESGAARGADGIEPGSVDPTVPRPPLERSGRPQVFEALRQTRYEIEDIAQQYREVFALPPVELVGAAASKRALLAQAPRARYLHLATHGWFASERFPSRLDSERGALGGPLAASEEMLIGFAPETLCGLALAGANRGPDQEQHVPGILTAEELSVFDLRHCDLAVLSACETNVGLRRAGQGIQSLQTALHAAGARTAITSLWRVDDAATRRLFERFYTELWIEGRSKAEALWRAKTTLRNEGHPLRDWAGWVLTGAPN